MKDLVRAIDQRRPNVDSLLFGWLDSHIADSEEFWEVADTFSRAGFHDRCRLVLHRGVDLFPEHDGLALLALTAGQSAGFAA